MKRKIWISTLAGAILILGTAANMSNNPSQTTSDDSVVINDWLIVGEPHATAFEPGAGALMVGFGNKATGDFSAVIGSLNQVSGKYSVALGVVNFSSSGSGNVMLGRGNNVSGYYSVAMGLYNTVSKWGAVAMGGSNTASGSYSLATGRYTTASGWISTAMGYGSVASGSYSVAMGSWSHVYGYGALGSGAVLNVFGNCTTVFGMFNESILASSSDDQYQDNADGHLFVIGNGSSNSSRSNAMVVYHDGAVDVGKNDADDTVPLQVTSDGSVILAKEQGDISMGAFGSSN